MTQPDRDYVIVSNLTLCNLEAAARSTAVPGSGRVLLCNAACAICPFCCCMLLYHLTGPHRPCTDTPVSMEHVRKQVATCVPTFGGKSCHCHLLDILMAHAGASIDRTSPPQEYPSTVTNTAPGLAPAGPAFVDAPAPDAPLASPVTAAAEAAAAVASSCVPLTPW
jgi:hypothetical protein